MKNSEEVMQLYAKTMFSVVEKFEFPRSFAIITAHNPEGAISNANINSLYDAGLRKHLTDNKQTLLLGSSSLKDENIKKSHPIIGCSPDMFHQEISYVINVSKEAAFEIADIFNQNAFFWVDSGQLSIVPVKLKGVDELSIGKFESRLISAIK
ncbi:DUF3293 domain-containing protein [Colwellia sp. BRX8-9]|uniref:DUF3293 domain-containing protein n=1 Tax=Colwellia sp. BRX8-9 TaxID=2759831 RepID=UPI0015F37599|nr:DUF3293 domain-containing protein [Colwellia sp. BRX8-9]MBA6350056.1 DUF3293 domain-containing protein [Colwellia sp. BRX8-9]